MAGPFIYITLRACCNPLVKYVYNWVTYPLPSPGTVFVDDSNVCWVVESASLQGCTNTSHVISSLTAYTGSGCDACIDDNPVSCPALDITNSYTICVWWWNLGSNVGFRLQSSGTPLNELYWTGAQVDAYTTGDCSGSISATGSWTGSTLMNPGGGTFNIGPTPANTFSGWDAGDISATVYNLEFSSATYNQAFTNLSNNNQFVICGPSGNELVTVFASECLGSNISPCSLPTPTPTPTITQTPTNTPTQTPTQSGLPDNCKCYQVAADVGPGFNSVSYLDCNHVPQQIDNIATSVYICAIDGSVSVTNLSFGEVDESNCGGCVEGATPTPTPNETPTQTPTPSITPSTTPFTNGAILNVSTTGCDIDSWGTSISTFTPTITYPISGGQFYNFQHSGWSVGDSIVVSVTGGTNWTYSVYKNTNLLFTSGYTSPYGETYYITESGSTSDFLLIEVSDVVSPTSTPTPTQTQTPTNTQTPTGTPPGNYQFQDCCDPTNIFRFSNVVGAYIPGDVLNISGSLDFNGCATVMINTGTGPVYSSLSVTFMGPYVDCNSCGTCPTPTPTTTETPTQTPTPTTTPTDACGSCNVYKLIYDASSCSTACIFGSGENFYYCGTPQSLPLSVGTILYTGATCTGIVPDGYYSDVSNGGSSCYTVSGGGGQITAVNPCSTPTETVTSTPTQTPTQTPVVPTVICKSATTTSLGWYYHDCCGNYVSGNDLGVSVCLDINRPSFGMTISGSDCLAPVCYSAATLADCCTGEIFFALVDQYTASGGPVEAGVVYRFNGRSYYFIQFGGPGGPYLGLPDYGSCDAANAAFPCVTPTATQQILPTPTPTVTPSPTPSICAFSAFCFTSQFSAYTGYNGTYYSAGTYNGDHIYYTGDTGVIYYFTSVTQNYWCLSSSLGGVCDLRGAVPCWSSCPDISGEIFSGGICPTPTPSPADCTTLDFLAYYDCDYEPLPTPTPSVPCDLVNFDFSGLGVTPTPSPSAGPCSWTLDFTLSGYTPPITPTVTSSPTVTITRTVDVAGQVSFKLIEDVFTCTTVKVLVDCKTGTEYLINQPLNYEGSGGLIPITSGFTMLVQINGTPTCVTYTEDRNGSSNTYVEQILSLLTDCTYCNTIPTQTPTATPTTTLTSTPTPSITASRTPTTTQTPTRTSTSTPTPTQSATFGTTPTPTPSITASATPTSTPTPSITATHTPTGTVTPTPSTTPLFVYVFESCSPIGIKVPAITQVIQTEPVGFAIVPTNIFKDEAGICWKFVGQYSTNYIPPVGMNSFTFGGNYFATANSFIYTDCEVCENIPTLDPCNTLLYFGLTKCSDGTQITATSCDLQDANGVSLVPPFGTSVVVVEFDNNGFVLDKFCAILSGQTVETQTNFTISLPPTGFTYNCDTCPLYYRYLISTCNADQSQVVNFPMYSPTSVGLLSVGTVISVNENANCWTIVLQEGLVEESYLGTLVGLNQAYTYQQTFIDCNTCLGEQTNIILSEPQTGTNPYDPNTAGGPVQSNLFLQSDYNPGEIIIIERGNNQ